jgi:excinuclease UvrABC ATPase subunit
VRGCLIGGRNIAELAAMQVSDLVGVVEAIDDPVAAPMVASLGARLGDMVGIGLGYLSLDRATSTLSGGESQRIKVVKHLGSSLTDLTYIFDEPSIGLHARDVERLVDLLARLKAKGNSVFVVEHDRDVIETADHVIDLGPGAGNDGGEVVYQGDVAGLVASGTRTGEHLRAGLPLKRQPRRPTGYLAVEHASLHNLADVSVRFPTGVMTVVTGVAGSGKSSLVNGAFRARYPEAVAVDQAPVATNRRSNPATYTGILDAIRARFATANQVSPSLFSANSKGACDNCQGLGVVWTDLAFLDSITSVCEVCLGRRFKDEVLAHTLRGRTIADVLGMTVAAALDFFTEARIRRVLATLRDVGLDYLTLGQPLSTLSGGECQRIKLAGELHRTGSVYVLDEPTTGLHMADTATLVAVMDRLVEQGATVIVIEHNLDVVKQADWVIDLGPEGGHDGGRVVFEGTPAQLAAAEGSITAAYLRRTL